MANASGKRLRRGRRGHWQAGLVSEQSVGFDSDESRFVGVESPACVVRLGIPVEFSGFFERTLTGPDWRPRAAQAKVVPYNTDQLAIGLSPGALRDITVRRNPGHLQVRKRIPHPYQSRLSL